MSRPRSPDDLHEQFETQWRLLAKSCNDFDAGDVQEAKRIALALRILLHDRGMSRSLMTQCGLADVLFHDTAQDVDRRNLAPTFGLVFVAMNGPEPRYVAPSPNNLSLGRPVWMIPFEHWWRKVVISIPGEFDLTRRDLVLTMADQDGGAHVDPELEERYYQLTRENRGGWTFETESGRQNLKHIESASIRQIAQEARVSLLLQHRMIPADLPAELPDSSWRAQFGTDRPTDPSGRPVEFRNMCPCHSGLEYKDCHMKGASNEGKIVPPIES